MKPALSHSQNRCLKPLQLFKITHFCLPYKHSSVGKHQHNKLLFLSPEDREPVISYRGTTHFFVPQRTRPFPACSYTWHVGNHQAAATGPHFTDTAHKHCMGQHASCVQRTLQAQMNVQGLSLTDVKWAEMKNSLILSD